MMRGIRGVLRRYLRDEAGNGVIEGVVLLPVLLMAWLGVYAFWEAFNARSAVQKAAFVSADLLSREMVPVSNGYLDGLDAAVEYLVDSRFDVTTRFTSYTRTGPLDTDVQVLWSYSPSMLMQPMVNADLVALAARLPVMTTGSTAVIVQTQMAYSVPFRVPIANYVVPASFSDMVVLRPRYVTKICRANIAC